MAQAALHRLRHPFGAREVEEFWALRDVSLEVERGEVLGVIGHNGAGKSTLLKILSRITPPSAGRVEVFGRIGSLLEVGTGFHPELTGRENIFLNGSILGMKHQEIVRQFDAIVEFSGVEQFLDTPVKRYSSGMYVRLAFSVAAHLETEILLLDEVLAVGDAEFQKKCLSKVGEASTGGRTVLLISHNLPVIQTISKRAALFEHGRLRAFGPTPEVVEEYASSSALEAGGRDLRDHPRPTFPMTRDALVTYGKADVVQTDTGGLDSIVVEMVVEAVEDMTIALVIHLHTPDGSYLATTDVDEVALRAGPNTLAVRIAPIDLRPAAYRLTLATTTPNPRFGYRVHDCIFQCVAADASLLRSEGGQVPPSWGEIRFRGELLEHRPG